jgi:two-component system cell cycle response regulator
MNRSSSRIQRPKFGKLQVAAVEPAKASDSARPSRSGTHPGIVKQRILVVDDHPVNCELLEALLVPQGYNVETANSGAEALALARTNPPDLVLLDVSMPGMDGFQVAEQLRGGAETRLIPIVMVTALGDLEHRVRGLEAGAEDYLAKPVNRTELLARVQSTLRLSYYRRQVDERQKLDLVLADVSDGIIIVNDHTFIREVNHCARRLLGLDSDVTGKALANIWGELENVPEALPEAVRHAHALEFVAQRTDPPLYIAVAVRPVHDMEGNPTGAVLSLRDVTRETLEHKLQEDVLSLVSHKFRTPLTVITLWTKMLQDGDCGPTSPEQQEALEAMTAASGQLKDLLEGMLSYLDWSRRLHRLQRRPVSFEDFEFELRERVQGLIGTEHRLVVARDGGGELLVDRELFLDAVVELVRNATKFASKSVEVRVELRRDGEHRRVVVADDGPGIPPEQLERVFERFYQVETDFTGQVHGMGLGLALVKTTVEALGGRIQAQSQLQKGSRFEIVL